MLFSYESSLVLRLKNAAGKGLFSRNTEAKLSLIFINVKRIAAVHSYGETARSLIGCSAATALAYRARADATSGQ